MKLTTYHLKTFSHGDSSGKCSKALINNNGDEPKLEWSKESCDDATGNGVLCNRRHFWEEIQGKTKIRIDRTQIKKRISIGCYVSPSYEFEGTTVVDITPNEPDKVKFCRESCKLHLARYFITQDTTDKCHCIITDNVPKGGLVDEEQCSRQTTCTTDQDPTTDDCYPDDGYIRGRLYKTYSLTCLAREVDYTTNFFFPWDHHGNWHVGSSAVMRCLPGYVLPPGYENGAVKYVSKTAKVNLDGTCGPSNPYNPTALIPSPGECNPADDGRHCCSPHGWCGSGASYCDCDGCIDYRDGAETVTYPRTKIHIMFPKN